MRTVAAHRIAPAKPPPSVSGWRLRTQRLLFSSRSSSLVTVVLALTCGALAWQLLRWGLIDAVFASGGKGPDACRVPGAGACWAVIGEKLRLMLFGIYPYGEQWRAAMAVVVLIAMYRVSVLPRLWNWRLPIVWLVALAAFGGLMWGGVFGMRYVPDDQWGGLPVTLILATLGLTTGFPLAILLALLRHSRRRGVGKALAVAYIELTRSVPLLTVLFLASVMIPLFLPQGMDVSKLLRVFVAFALFIAFFKATSIVVVVGIFDLMTAANRAAADSVWQGFGTEIYLFVAVVYFVFCFAMSRYSARLQTRLDAGRAS